MNTTADLTLDADPSVAAWTLAVLDSEGWSSEDWSNIMQDDTNGEHDMTTTTFERNTMRYGKLALIIIALALAVTAVMVVTAPVRADAASPGCAGFQHQTERSDRKVHKIRATYAERFGKLGRQVFVELNNGAAYRLNLCNRNDRVYVWVGRTRIGVNMNGA